MTERRDAIVVGSGPNGLAAAIALARAGRSVLVLEAAATIGGGTRSAELTLPGFRHDVCSAIHPLALASPFLRSLPLHEHGLEFVHPEIPLAHPLDDGTRGRPASLGRRDGRRPGSGRRVLPRADGAADRRVGSPASTTSWVRSTCPATRCRARASHAPGCARRRASRARASPATRARALLAGNAAHSMRPLTRPTTAGFGLLLMMLGHAVGWPAAVGGSQAIADAMASLLRSLGGEIRDGQRGALARRRARRAARCCSTSRRGRSSRSPATSCPRATAAHSAASATAPASSSWTTRSPGRCPGRPRSAVAPGRSTWAGRSRRSRGPRPRSRRADIPSGRTCSSPSRACSIRAGRRRGRTRCGPTATCRTARRST